MLWFSIVENLQIKTMLKIMVFYLIKGFPDGSAVKNPPASTGDSRRHRFDRWVRKMPWRKKRQPILVFLSGKSHGQRSTVGYSSFDCKESDMAEQITHKITSNFNI